MKHLKHLFTALLLLCSTVAMAHDFSVNDIYYNIISTSKKTVEVTFEGYNSWTSEEYTGSVTIPSTVTYRDVIYSVTSIGDDAFNGCNELTSVTIPNSVTSIGIRAFNGCSSLKTVYNFSNLTFTKGSYDNGLVACYAEKVVNAPAPNGVIFNDFVFSTVDGFHTLVKYFGNAAELVLPGNYNGENYKIGENAFNGNTTISGVTIPSGVTSIGNNAFYNTGWWNTQSDGLVYKDGWLLGYKGSKPADAVIIDEGTKGIAGGAFKGCTSLTSITIPNSVTSIGGGAFSGCTSLTSITIPNSVTSIGDGAFEGCNIIRVEINNMAVAVAGAFNGMTSIREVVIGKNILNIPGNAFNGCTNLTSLTISYNVNNVEQNAFNSCDNIEKVFWLTNTPPAGYELLDGKINYVSNELYTKLTGEVVVSKFLSSKFEIGGIQYIPTSVADRRCCVVDYAASSKLSSIVVSDSVSYSGVQFEVCDIMPYAFYDNDTAGSLTLKNCGNIGTSAFEDCDSLTSVVISKSITSVSDFAFKGCAALVNASFSDRETILPLGRRLFDDTKLDYLYIGSKISYINEASYETSPFCNNKTLRSLVITDVENEIYDYEFYGCSNLQTAVVGDGVEKIGRWAFSGCGSLQEFVFGSNVSSIGEEAFSDCVNVTKITGRAILPPVCGAQALDDINKFNCTLYVPSHNLSEYLAADQWKEFPFIENLVTNDNYVTYMIDGEVYKTLLLTPGKRIIAPYVPDKDGVPFDGWDMEEFMTIPNPAPASAFRAGSSLARTASSVSYEVIDLAGNADAMLYTNAPCTSTQWGDQFTSWAVLFDNNTGTMFHSEYNNVESVDALDHYIRVDMGEGNSVGCFTFTYTTRVGNASTLGVCPKTMVVEGSNSANGNYTVIETLTDLPYASETVYESTTLGSDDAQYRYIRFRVTDNYSGQTDNGHKYFAISEFGMTKVSSETVEPELESTIIDTSKYYTIECKSIGGHTSARSISDNGSVIDGQSSSATEFVFESAGNDSYYIKSVVSGKYINHDGTNISASTSKITTWTVNVPSHTAGVVTFTIGGDKYLNNNGSDCIDGTCQNLKANYHSDGPTATHYCSLWVLSECEQEPEPTPDPEPEFGLNERVPIMPDRDIVIYGYYKSYEVTGITLDRTAITVQEGDNVTLTATVSPDNATDKTVTWSSSNTNVATVYNGVVIAVASGTAVITAQAGSHTAYCSVTVDVNDTAVEEVKTENGEVKVVYDLKGVRVLDTEDLEHGIYIINGKKMIIK